LKLVGKRWEGIGRDVPDVHAADDVASAVSNVDAREGGKF
jgi:hypothetical protein